jgi:hypothetical protein
MNGGQAPSAYVFNPTDDEALDLAAGRRRPVLRLRAVQAPVRAPCGVSRGSPRPLSRPARHSWPTGTQAELLVREGATLAVDTGGTLFDKNQAKMRVEGRFGLAVKRPAAFATIDLTA